MLSLLLLPTAGSAEPGDYPGLPVVQDPGPPFPPTVGTDADRNVFSWLNAPYNGVTGSARSEQWVRLPTRALASNAALFTCNNPLNTSPGAGAPCEFPAPQGSVTLNLLDVAAFLVSPDGAPAPYGYGPLIPVRSVAFGSIPVEVVLQLNQVRDADGLPIPFRGDIVEYTSREPGVETQTNTMAANTLRGQVELRVVDARVDGVDLDLEDCVTPPIDLVTRSEEATGPVGEETSWIDPDRSTYGYSGGGFAGTVDVPPLQGCTTPEGDDLAAVLSSMLAGPGNPVSLRYGAMFCASDFLDNGSFKPTPPGADLPEEAGCAQFELGPPGDERWLAIPPPREYPTYAPGDAGQ